MKRKKDGKCLFDINDRNFNVRAWYLKDAKKSKGDALVEIRHNGKKVKEFIFPAYKIYNIAAHFSDIVDSEVNKNDRGYRIAGSTGFGGVIMPKKV